MSTSTTLTLGADLRVRLQDYRPTRFGIDGADDTFALYRGLASADLRVGGRWQAFVQLGAHAETGRLGGPGRTDQSALDAHQAFVAWRRDAWAVKLGRQEASFGSSRLVSLRDGPNIRLAFDGARVSWTPGAHRLDLIALRPVGNRPGAFDDPSDRSQAMWGAYATLAPPTTAPLQFDAYWLGYRRDGARFAIGRGNEYRHSFGTRVFGASNGWDWNWEGVYQHGRFEDDDGRKYDIRAWTLASDNGYTFASFAWTPRVSLKADLASGDAHADDDRLQTFNALYPRASYFSEASLLAPANLIDVQPALTLRPRDTLQFTLGWDFAWKHRRADAVYTTPTPLLAVPGTAGTRRRIGDQIKLEGSYRPRPDWEIQLHLVHFRAGPALRDAGGDDVDFISTTVAWQW